MQTKVLILVLLIATTGIPSSEGSVFKSFFSNVIKPGIGVGLKILDTAFPVGGKIAHSVANFLGLDSENENPSGFNKENFKNLVQDIAEAVVSKKKQSNDGSLDQDLNREIATIVTNQVNEQWKLKLEGQQKFLTSKEPIDSDKLEKMFQTIAETQLAAANLLEKAQEQLDRMDEISKKEFLKRTKVHKSLQREKASFFESVKHISKEERKKNKRNRKQRKHYMVDDEDESEEFGSGYGFEI